MCYHLTVERTGGPARRRILVGLMLAGLGPGAARAGPPTIHEVLRQPDLVPGPASAWTAGAPETWVWRARERGAAGIAGSSVTWSFLEQTCPARPRRFYDVTARVRADIPPGPYEEPWNIFVWLDGLDAHGRVVQTDWGIGLATHVWTETRRLVVASGEVRSWKIRLAKRQGAGFVWFDRVSVLERPEIDQQFSRSVWYRLMQSAPLLRYHASVISVPYQMDYNEGAMLTLTRALVQGVNPFDPARHPELSTQYGLVYNVCVLPLARWFGATFLVHRLVTGSAIVGCCVILFLIFRDLRVSWTLSWVMCLIWYAQLLIFVTPLARPDGVGLFLFMLTLYSAWRSSYSVRGLLLSGAFGLLAFFTKTYFVLAPMCVAGYVFTFVSRRRGTAFLAGFSCALVGTAFVVDHFFPGYWREILLNINAPFNVRYLGAQSLLYGRFLVELSFSLPMVAGIWWYAGFTANRATRDMPRSRPGLFYFSLLGVVMALCRMGGNGGAYLTYYFQLLSPFVLIAYARLVDAGIGSRAWLVTPFLIWNLFRISQGYLPPFDTPQYRAPWEEISRQVAAHHRVLNMTPAVAGVLAMSDRPVYATGLSEYFTLGTKKESFLKRFLTPTDRQVLEIDSRRSAEIQNGIMETRWDLIISGYQEYQLLERYYQPFSWVVVSMPPTWEEWRLVLWAPK